MSPEEFAEIYEAKMHAVQTGVAFTLTHNAEAAQCKPKHLRVGINGARMENAALVKTLFDAGLISEEKLQENMIFFLDQEIASYERELTQAFGRPVKLA